MAGHSKWANIQHRKGKQDAKRGKLFTKLIREITVAAKMGAGGNVAENVEEIRYEGYGPGGVAVMVDCMSDNRNRTVGEVRHAFNKCGGNLGTDGSVAYLFKKVGQISFPAGSNEESLW